MMSCSNFLSKVSSILVLMLIAPMLIATITSNLAFAEEAGTDASQIRQQPNVSQTSLYRAGTVNVSYFGIFQGPALKNTSGYQPDLMGVPDPNRPVMLRNFLGLGYNITDSIAITGTGYWTWQPAQNGMTYLQDPFLKLSNNSLLQSDNWNLYGDLRLHFGASSISRGNDLLCGLQLVQGLMYGISSSRLSLGLFGSARANFFGSQGFGNDLELYLAPNVNYQISPTVALTLLYEMHGSHTFGKPPWVFNSEGTDLQPGINWDITPRIMVNPYLNLMTGGKITLASTSVGLLVSFVMI